MYNGITEAFGNENCHHNSACNNHRQVLARCQSEQAFDLFSV